MSKQDNRRIVMGVGDNPNTVLSYGILANYLTRATVRNFQWNFIVNGYTHGAPEIYSHWIKWASGKNEVERDSIHVPKLIKKIRPEFVLTIGDWQHFRMTRYYIEKTVPWIHWLPIDHGDPHHLYRALTTIGRIDIPVLMSKYSFDFIREAGLDVKHYIYPFVQTRPLPKYMGDNKFSGFKVITEVEEQESLERLRKEIGAEDKQVLLWVGRPGWRKNLQMLIGAFRLLLERGRKDVILYLHTDPNDPSATFNMGKEIHAQRIPKELIKFTTEAEWDIGAPQWYLNGLYNMADVYVSTHGGEGFGIPFAEAMACETPFVATNCTTTPELGKNKEGQWKRGLGVDIEENHEDRGVIRPYVDLDDFADKVEFLLDRPDKRKRMGKAGRQWVVKNCSIPVVANKWKKIFKETLIKRVIIGGINEE